MKEQYDLDILEYVRCERCGNSVALLRPKRTTLIDLNNDDLAAQQNLFYICWHCREVSQVGYGVLR